MPPNEVAARPPAGHRLKLVARSPRPSPPWPSSLVGVLDPVHAGPGAWSPGPTPRPSRRHPGQAEGRAAAATLHAARHVQAFSSAPIHARTNGYLKRWYTDIGARCAPARCWPRSTPPSSTSNCRRPRPTSPPPSPTRSCRRAPPPLAGPGRPGRRLQAGGRREEAATSPPRRALVNGRRAPMCGGCRPWPRSSASSRPSTGW